jgi:predicted GIY-YIG superfamily endonuclease
MDKQFCVYILASKRNGTLYIGVTSQLATRVWQHKSKVVEGFTTKTVSTSWSTTKPTVQRRPQSYGRNS